MIPHDLSSADYADRRAHDHIARPMPVIVHARGADKHRAAIHRGPHIPHRFGTPASRFVSYHRRRRESYKRMPRRKAAVFVTLESAAELEIVRLVVVDKWASSPRGKLYDVRDGETDDDRLRAVEAQVRHAIVVGKPSGRVQGASNEECAGLGDRFYGHRHSLEESVRLGRALQVTGKASVEWNGGSRDSREANRNDGVTRCEERFIRSAGIGGLRACKS